MTAFLVIFGRVFSELWSRLGRWLPGWIGVGGIAVSASAALKPTLALALGLIFLMLPILYLLIHAFIATITYWRHEGWVLLFDVTRRQFYTGGHVHESWTREIRNVSTNRTEDTLDFPMYWDIPLEQIHPVAIHVSKRNANRRVDTESQVYEISRKCPEYTERLFEGRTFYGCVIPLPLGLEPGESMLLKLIYRHIVSTPTDDQIIRAMPRLLRLSWEGNAKDGLTFDPKRSFVEARYHDPTSAARPRETRRASRCLRFEEADTRMVLDLPIPRPGYHYRVVFTLKEMGETQQTRKGGATQQSY